MSAHCRILVIDDDATICEAVAEVITAEGYAVQTAPDGAAGLALIKEHGFDLIIVDLVMRGMDGMTVLRSVKADDPDAVVIVITAHGTDGGGRAGDEAGRLRFPLQALYPRRAEDGRETGAFGAAAHPA